MTKNYYQVLGVPETASATEIKRAYRVLALKCHPDRNPGDLAAEQQFKDLSEAYEILGDTKKRSTYDTFRRAIESVPDLFARHDTGRHLLEVMLPSSRSAKVGGVHGVMVKRVSSQLLIDGGSVFVSMPKYDTESEVRKVRITVTPGTGSPRWLRFSERGFPGQNGGNAGDLWIVLIPQPEKRR